jgi:hypothetical protein
MTTDPVNPTEPVPVKVIPKSLIEIIGGDALRAGPYAALLLFALWWMNTQWQADKLAAATAQAAQILATADAVKKQAELAALAVEKVAVQQTLQLKDQADSFEKQQARTERLMGERITVNARRVEDVEKKVTAVANQLP